MGCARRSRATPGPARARSVRPATPGSAVCHGQCGRYPHGTIIDRDPARDPILLLLVSSCLGTAAGLHFRPHDFVLMRPALAIAAGIGLGPDQAHDAHQIRCRMLRQEQENRGAGDECRGALLQQQRETEQAPREGQPPAPLTRRARDHEPPGDDRQEHEELGVGGGPNTCKQPSSQEVHRGIARRPRSANGSCAVKVPVPRARVRWR